ncbi:MAG: hypothetical protein HY560_11940 [Gemmatimonadetes bacterium]|nr:hypothetical protein [Gemmatimonadota bacterium]
MSHPPRTWFPLTSLTLLVLACGSPPEAVVGGEPGEPLPGLTEAQLARFVQGKALFDRVFQPGDGLGPLFNENQCSGCHTDPASGGTGEQRVIKATRFAPPATCDYLTGERGQNVRRQATAALMSRGVDREQAPPDATERGQFTAPFLFGLGLVEAITDVELLRHADPEDRDGDGISVRVGRAPGGAVGRFGRKADVATLVNFVTSALRLEMGLTSPLAPVEQGLNGGPLPDGTDPVPDPEVDLATLERLVDFVRFLGPLAPEPLAQGARRDSLVRGERLFSQLGCASCHVPRTTTGPSEIAALDRKTVSLYSDLLLHDLGPELAGVCGPGAAPAELRTEMLAGLRYRRTYLHDGRALDLREAILGHGGEAAKARVAFARLDFLSQLLLLRFLNSI